jgi:hypothetical protein
MNPTNVCKPNIVYSCTSILQKKLAQNYCKKTCPTKLYWLKVKKCKMCKLQIFVITNMCNPIFVTFGRIGTLAEIGARGSGAARSRHSITEPSGANVMDVRVRAELQVELTAKIFVIKSGESRSRSMSILSSAWFVSLTNLCKSRTHIQIMYIHTLMFLFS